MYKCSMMLAVDPDASRKKDPVPTKRNLSPSAAAALVTAMPLRPTQPLWRFALIGLGPLSAMAIFALLIELTRRLS